MIFLRQSTASQEIPLGRFVDSTNGDGEKTALTIANTDIKLWKMGATALVNKNSGGGTHMAGGEYYCVLDATDSDTLGSMKVSVHVAGALAVQVWCCVLSAERYDWLIAATNKVQVNVVEWVGGAIPAVNVTGVPRVDLTHLLGTAHLTPAVAGTPDVNANATAVAAIQSGLATSAALATVAGYIDGEVATLVAGMGALTAGERNAIADAIFARSLGAESYAAPGAVPTFAQFCFMVFSGLFEFSISGTTITAKRLDGSTTAMTFTLDSSSAPTSRTRAA